MPENQQGFARSIEGKKYIEEGTLIGIGVLLVFLGVLSKVPITSVLSVVTGVLLFYAAYRLYGSRSDAEKISDDAGKIIDHKTEPVISAAERSAEEYFSPIDDSGETEFQSTVTERREAAKKHFTANDFMEVSPQQSMSNAAPHNELNVLLLKVLHAVKEVCFAHTVTFFWINHESKQLVVEAKITESSSFSTERKIEIGTDIVSRIGQSGAPEIVNNIMTESERDLLRYYSSLQDVKSFIGVPVFFASDTPKQLPIGVIAVDSKAEDAFGDETVSILSHFSKLVSALVVSSTEKYDLAADVKLVRADSQLKKRISLRPTIPVLVNSYVEEMENVIAWDAICVIMFDEGQRAWSLASVRVRGNEKLVSPKQMIDLEFGVVGNAIRTNSVATIDLSANRQIVFNAHESGSELLRHGTLAVVPFSSNGKCYGAVAVISREPGGISKKDIAAIGLLSSSIAPACEIIELNAIVSEHIAVDEQTGVYSQKYFSLRLIEELSRSNDRQEDLTMVLIALSSVPEIENRYGTEGKSAAMQSVAQQIRRSTRPYDIVARFDATTFAVLLADTIANEAYLWADKLRTSIAGSIVTFDKKSFSISVTIGISGAASKMAPEELVKNTSLVLDQAKKAGGNMVRVF